MKYTGYETISEAMLIEHLERYSQLKSSIDKQLMLIKREQKRRRRNEQKMVLGQQSL